MAQDPPVDGHGARERGLPHRRDAARLPRRSPVQYRAQHVQVHVQDAEAFAAGINPPHPCNTHAPPSDPDFAVQIQELCQTFDIRHQGVALRIWQRAQEDRGVFFNMRSSSTDPTFTLLPPNAFSVEPERHSRNWRDLGLLYGIQQREAPASVPV